MVLIWLVAKQLQTVPSLCCQTLEPVRCYEVPAGLEAKPLRRAPSPTLLWVPASVVEQPRPPNADEARLRRARDLLRPLQRSGLAQDQNLFASLLVWQVAL